MKESRASRWLLRKIFLLKWALAILLTACFLLLCQLEHETVAQTKLDEEEARVQFPDKETEIRPPR